MCDFFGFNCFALTELEAFALEMHLPRLRARRRREMLEMAGRRLSVEDVHALVLAETEDAKQADEAAAEYAAQLLRAEQQVSDG